MKQWIRKTYQIDAQKIAERYKISEVVAKVLVKRGLFDWDAMDRYLFPDLSSMYDARMMKDMEKAVHILEGKIEEKKKIKIIGDYDVDGVMSTYILYQGIQMLGGMPGYQIPHRVHDGYGIRDYMATEAFEEGYDTIITCDNGISAMEAVRKAKELGMTVLLTDHHEVPCVDGEEMIPPADAVVDPKQKACEYPDKNLCGAGIAYKMMAYVLARKGIDAEKSLLPYAAVATVCDVVPLLGENRIIVKNGIDYLEKCQDAGMHALIQAQQFTRKINAGDLGFRIGPCINAAGRLTDATDALELFLERDEQKAVKRAAQLVALNQERKDYTALATQKAIDLIESSEIKKDKVYVVCLEDCHESVAGIVAGRIREKYYRPTLILTKGRDGLKGSGRSIPGYHMQQGLLESREYLTEFGGHAMAAGFSLKAENLEHLRNDLNEKCSLTQEDLIEKLVFDEEVALDEVTETMVHQLEWMEPFGQDNARAVFARREVMIVSVALCGNENQIARLRIKDGMRIYQGVDFQCELHVAEAIRTRYGQRAWEELLSGSGKEYKVDILYCPGINQRYGGVQFDIIDCR